MLLLTSTAFFKIIVFKNSFQEHYQRIIVSNGLDQDQQFPCFIVVCLLAFFFKIIVFKIIVFKKIFQEHYQGVNRFGS